MQNGSRVDLPAHVVPPFEVFVNGVPQVAGTDYRHEGTALYFQRELSQEGKLGFWRWLSMVLGIAGTYRKHESVDIISTVNGQRVVTTLAIQPEQAPGGSRD